MRRLIPERVRDAVDGILDRVRSPATACLAPRLELAGKGNGPGSRWRSSRSGGRRGGRIAPRPWPGFVRHARAVDAIFKGQAQDMAATPGQVQELHEARAAFNDLRPTVPTMPRRFTSGTRVCHGCGFGGS